MDPDRPLPQREADERPDDQPRVPAVTDQQHDRRGDEHEDLQIPHKAGDPDPRRECPRGRERDADDRQSEHDGRGTGEGAAAVAYEAHRAVQHDQTGHGVGEGAAPAVASAAGSGDRQRQHGDQGDQGQHGKETARRGRGGGEGRRGQYLGHHAQLPVGRTSAAAVRSRMHTSCQSDQLSMYALSNRQRSSMEVSPRSPWICASPVIPVRIR